VVYEVLSGQTPFSKYHDYAVVVAVLKGGRPARPQGAEGRWFTDDIWSILECCWKPIRGDRAKIKDVLHCLEQVSSSWTLPQTIADPTTMPLPTLTLESSTEESTDEDGVSVSRQLSQRLCLEDLSYNAQGQRALGTAAENLDGSGESERMLDRAPSDSSHSMAALRRRRAQNYREAPSQFHLMPSEIQTGGAEGWEQQDQAFTEEARHRGAVVRRKLPGYVENLRSIYRMFEWADKGKALSAILFFFHQSTSELSQKCGPNYNQL